MGSSPHHAPRPDLLCVGVITGPRGLRGDVRLLSYTADPEAVTTYGPLTDESGDRVYSLRVVGHHKDRLIARIEGVEDRTAAEALTNTRLYMPRDRLPEPDRNEYYHADLLGLEAVRDDGTLMGRVRAVHDFGAGDLIEIEDSWGRTAMVPFSHAVVPVVEVPAGRLVVRPPAGLLPDGFAEPPTGDESEDNGAPGSPGDRAVTEKRSLPWTARVLTLCPEMFPGPLGLSLAGRGLEMGRWVLETVDIREFARDKHRSVDDAPFGGGPGMVMRPDVVDTAIASVVDGPPGGPLLYLTPRGQPLTQAWVRDLAAGDGMVLLCGRFEGVDERVLEARSARPCSLGDFVLSGGEPAAIALIDACVRLLPGVVGAEESLAEESFESGLLEYPHYTRPREWRGRRVPEVLLSGDHGRIRASRRAWAEDVTRKRRPDLWARYRDLDAECAGPAGRPEKKKGGTS